MELGLLDWDRHQDREDLAKVSRSGGVAQG